MSYASKEIVRLAGRAVHQYDLIREGDRVLVGVSGGKDSLMLLEYLVGRRKRSPVDFGLAAAHLDMGYEVRSEKEALSAYIKELGVETVFEDTDYAVRAHSDENRENPCFLCSRLRRKRLFELAREMGCNKVALGHHRDDLIETLLLNIFYAGEISTMLPAQEFFGGLLTVIRPLCMVPEDKVRRAAAERGLPVAVNACPSSGASKREEVKEVLAGLARKNDKIKGNVFRALSNWRPEYLLPRTGPSGRTAGGRRSRKRSGESRLKEHGVMEKDIDQRKRTRVSFTTSVSLSNADVDLPGLATKDLSLKGLYVVTDKLLPIDTFVDVTLDLSGTTSRVSLYMKGKVARVDSHGMGIDFTEIDMDSFHHLRNIVLYNAGDPADVDNELATKAF